MGRLTTPLTKAIHAIGMSTADFAKECLGLTYPTFSYRIRVGHLSQDDYWKISFYTGKTFEELFPNPYQPLPHKPPVSVTIPRTTPLPAVRKKPLPEITPHSGPKEHKKEEVATATPSAPSADSFELIETFPGGIPPIPEPAPE